MPNAAPNTYWFDKWMKEGGSVTLDLLNHHLQQTVEDDAILVPYFNKELNIFISGCFLVQVIGSRKVKRECSWFSRQMLEVITAMWRSQALLVLCIWESCVWCWCKLSYLVYFCAHIKTATSRCALVGMVAVAAGTELSKHFLSITPFPIHNSLMKCGHWLTTEDPDSLNIVCKVMSSQWQNWRWARGGGCLEPLLWSTRPGKSPLPILLLVIYAGLSHPVAGPVSSESPG